MGTDGQIWGGEFLVCDSHGFERRAHLRYAALPGGDRAARQGWRMAAAHLYDALGPEYRQLDLPCWSAAPAATWRVIDRLIAKPDVLTSSVGRLFDAVSAICGVSQESTYEGESAMLLEAAANESCGETYRIDLNTETLPWIVDTRPMMVEIARAIASGASPGRVSRCFHDSLALMIETVCSRLREGCGVDKVCLSGGAFQNFTLLQASANLLRRSGFQVYLHSQVPPNDGGLSLGQAVIAATYLERTPPDVSGDSR
jgi:hydrogenase maturation protein HypF